MKIVIALTLSFLFLACHQESSSIPQVGIAVNTQVAPKIEDAIPPGYSIVTTKEGKELIYDDLNGDGKTDAVVLVAMQGDPDYDQMEEVVLMIFTADRHGQFQIASASNNLGGESSLYHNSKSLSVKKNVISYFHQSMRHDFTAKFRYDNKLADFILIGKEYNEYGSMEQGYRRISINYLTGIKLINSSLWDDQLEEAVEQPLQKEIFSRDKKVLSELDWETIYDDL